MKPDADAEKTVLILNLLASNKAHLFKLLQEQEGMTPAFIDGLTQRTGRGVKVVAPDRHCIAKDLLAKVHVSIG